LSFGIAQVHGAAEANGSLVLTEAVLADVSSSTAGFLASQSFETNAGQLNEFLAVCVK